jgi:hypothetical protein
MNARTEPDIGGRLTIFANTIDEAISKALVRLSSICGDRVVTLESVSPTAVDALGDAVAYWEFEVYWSATTHGDGITHAELLARYGRAVDQ